MLSSLRTAIKPNYYALPRMLSTVYYPCLLPRRRDPRHGAADVATVTSLAETLA